MKLMELHKGKIIGAIRGLDRIRFRGTLRWIANETGIKNFLNYYNILLKDFSQWANSVTSQVRRCCENQAKALGIETLYLRSSSVDKDKLARKIAEEKGIERGPVCLLSVVEPCISPTIKGDRALKKLTLKMMQRKCVWLYYYFNDPTFGFGHVRLQSWLPLNVFICLNGRHWLERQLQDNGMAYIKDGNCLPWIEDVQAAQTLMNQQLESHWPQMLNKLTFSICPELEKEVLPFEPQYYWSADETEWATDIMFNSTDDLDRLYSLILKHSMQVSDSPSVMRYFGMRNISPSGRIKGKTVKEIMSDCRRRYEGIRVKHWKNCNSLKMYNKSGSILRIETTINSTRDFRVYRHPDDDEKRPASWHKMRKGVSDLHRRCQISDQCNDRYADALAAAQVEERLKEVFAPACNKIRKNGKIYRGLNPWQEQDHRLLSFLAKGENALSGFRNKDLRRWLYPESEDAEKQQHRRCAGRTTRRIKLLRVHGLVKKVAKENRYMLTAKGQKFACALMCASAADIKGLTELAA